MTISYHALAQTAVKKFEPEQLLEDFQAVRQSLEEGHGGIYIDIPKRPILIGFSTKRQKRLTDRWTFYADDNVAKYKADGTNTTNDILHGH